MSRQQRRVEAENEQHFDIFVTFILSISWDYLENLLHKIRVMQIKNTRWQYECDKNAVDF
jgi:hypothetical protein